MWIKEQESRFCNEITANPFYLSTLPIQGSIQEAALYLSLPAVGQTGDTTSCTAVVNRGAGKTPNWPPPLLWQSQIPFQEKPNPTSHSWVLEMARKCKHWWQYSSTSPRDNKDTTPTSRSSSSALVCSSGDKLLPVLQAGNSEPLLITMITSWFCFLWTSLPLPAFEEATCHMLSGMFWNRPV